MVLGEVLPMRKWIKKKYIRNISSKRALVYLHSPEFIRYVLKLKKISTTLDYLPRKMEKKNSKFYRLINHSSMFD